MIDFGASETIPRLVNYVCRHSALSGNDKLWCFRDHSLVLWTMYVDIIHYRAMKGFGVSEIAPLVLWTMYVDIEHYRAMIWFGVQRPLPRLVNYVCRHSTISGNERLWVFQRPLPRLLNYVCRHSTLSGNGSLWCFRDHSLVLWTMYVDIVHYRAMIDFGVSETTPALVNYVCRHSALSGNDRLWCFRDLLPRLVNYVCRHSTISGNERLWCFRDHSLVF